ncbi:unnamed protein product [Heligmosomoides polygyrus]|uniref:Uncharacterized protein n=1 Tax=Heligmosomoides polygyrus TaxID=6339 RepID=A0A183F650_HELPZ|nr:unnamed protein product [Heligmosomoides polygyrus]
MELASRMVSAMTRATEVPDKAKPCKVGMVVDVSDARFIGGLIPCKSAISVRFKWKPSF